MTTTGIAMQLAASRGHSEVTPRSLEVTEVTREVGGQYDCLQKCGRLSPLSGQVLSGAATETPPPPAPVNVCVLLLSRRIIINAARSVRLAASEVEPWLSSSLVRWPELENASAQVESRTQTAPGQAVLEVL